MWRGICLIFLSETVLCAIWWLQVWCSHLINRPTHDKTKSPSEGTQKATWTEHVNTMKLVKLFLDGQSNLQACFCLEQVHTRLGRYSCRGILPSLLILRVSSGLPPASLWRVSLDSHCLFLQPWRWRYSWNQKQPLNSGSSTPCLPPKPQKWLAPIQRVWVWGIPDPSGAWPILNPSIAPRSKQAVAAVAPKPSQTANWISSNAALSCAPRVTLIRRRSPGMRFPSPAVLQMLVQEQTACRSICSLTMLLMLLKCLVFLTKWCGCNYS